MKWRQVLESRFLGKALLYNNGIARRIMLAVIVFSALITVVITGAELYMNYRTEMRDIDARVESIRQVYLPTITESVWVAEPRQLKNLLDGLLNLRDIEYVAVVTEDTPQWSAGKRVSTRQVEHVMSLTHVYRGENVEIAKLHVVASVDQIFHRLWSGLLTELVGNAIQTLLVTVFVLLIVQIMVGQHLEHISTYLRKFSKNITGSHDLQLNRAPDGLWRPDAFDHVTKAINAMRLETAQAHLELKNSNERLHTIISTSPLAIYTRDLNGVVTSWNPAAERLFGWPAIEAIGHPIRTVPQNRQAEYEQLTARLLRGESISQLEVVLRRRDDQLVQISLSAAPMHDADGSPYGYLIILADITERKSAEAALRKSEERLRLSTSLAKVAVWEYDVLADEMARSSNHDAIYGITGQETWRAETFLDATHPDDRERIYPIIQAALAPNGPDEYAFDFRVTRPDGVMVWLNVVGEIVKRDAAGQGLLIRGCLTDITNRKQAEERINFLAFHDVLTQLPNRQLLQERFEQARNYATRGNARIAVVFIDLDDFKRVNDSLGHDVGDIMLKEMAQRLGACVRETDTVSRQGGDEFILLLTNIDSVGDVAPVVSKVMEKIRHTVEINGLEISSSASLGIAIYPDDGADFETLLKKADMAMYQAKNAGRNTYRFFDEDINTQAIEHLVIRNGLTRALSRQEFVLHFQPQIDLPSHMVTGVEALIRWNHPKLGMVPPARFIPVAEESGLIVPIGEWVLQEACAQAMAWKHAGLPDLRVAVNLSAVQFKRGDLEQSVTQALRDSGLNPAFLELELTESMLIHNVESVLASVRNLKQLGVKFSIDDFGTGYSSLSYLKRLDIDKLKIDQSFVRDLATDPDDAAIVQAIIHMASSLKLRTIAEGVETPQMLSQLRALNCDEAQGYLFARPMPADELMAYLRQSVSPQS